MAIAPSLQAFTVTLTLDGRNGATALQRSKRAQKNAKSRHIGDGVTDEHVWISLLVHSGLSQWKTASWRCWWKLRSGAHTSNPVIIDSSKAGTAETSSRTHSADFRPKAPSNHCLQLMATNHKLLPTRNKTGQRTNFSRKSVSLIIRIKKSRCRKWMDGLFTHTIL